MVRSQEAVMKQDNESLLNQLVKLKGLVDQLTVVFHKIDMNPQSDGHADPIEWGQEYAKFSFPLSERVPTHSGMHLPIFHVRNVLYFSLTDRFWTPFLGGRSMRVIWGGMLSIFANGFLLISVRLSLPWSESITSLNIS